MDLLLPLMTLATQFMIVVLLIKMGMVERAIEASEMMIEELGLVTYSVAAHNYACSYSNGRMKETAEMILRSEL